MHLWFRVQYICTLSVIYFTTAILILQQMHTDDSELQKTAWEQLLIPGTSG